MAFLGAAGIVVIMFFVGASVEVLIETMKNVRGIGTLTGFLTNGPEMLVMVVGLINDDILFAASTPLGSNYMNPVLLLAAALLTRHVMCVWRVSPSYFVTSLVLTALIAGGFFLLPQATTPYWIWVIVALGVGILLFVKRPSEDEQEEHQELAVHHWWFGPALLVLLAAGYALDPVVSFTSDNSHVPKGVIGFLVLATLTSWPEFKSTLALLRRRLCRGALLNIVVSNITNLWLAVAGVTVYLMMR
jgi:cation:H+ antiporter